MSDLNFITSVLTQAMNYSGFSNINGNNILNGPESESLLLKYKTAVDVVFDSIKPNFSNKTFVLQLKSESPFLFSCPSDFLTLEEITFSNFDSTKNIWVLFKTLSSTEFEWGFLNGDLHIKKHDDSYIRNIPISYFTDPLCRAEMVYVSNLEFSNKGLETNLKMSIIHHVAKSICAANNKTDLLQYNMTEHDRYLRMARDIEGKRHGMNNNPIRKAKKYRFPYNF